MIWAAAILLTVGALVHSWYAGNSRVRIPSDAAMGFFMFGNYAVGLAIVLLIAGLVLLWIAKGFLWVIVGAIAYFYVLPMITAPLLVAFKLLPRYTLPWLDK